MPDEVETIEQSEPVQEQEEELSPSPAPSPSPMVTEPVEDQYEAPVMQDAAAPSFQERMDVIRDSFRETYQAFGSKRDGAWTAFDELGQSAGGVRRQDDRGQRRPQ